MYSVQTIILSLSLSLVFCRHQQVHDVFNVTCLEVILQVRGRDGMSTLQNGAAAYSQSYVFARVVSRCLPCGFRLPECPSPMVGQSRTGGVLGAVSSAAV